MKEYSFMDSTLKTLSNYRLEKSQQCHDSAKLLYKAGDYKGAANRNYYCVFHAIRSVLALEGVDLKNILLFYLTSGSIILKQRNLKSRCPIYYQKYIKQELIVIMMISILFQKKKQKNKSKELLFF